MPITNTFSDGNVLSGEMLNRNFRDVFSKLVVGFTTYADSGTYTSGTSLNPWTNWFSVPYKVIGVDDANARWEDPRGTAIVSGTYIVNGSLIRAYVVTTGVSSASSFMTLIESGAKP